MNGFKVGDRVHHQRFHGTIVGIDGGYAWIQYDDGVVMDAPLSEVKRL